MLKEKRRLLRIKMVDKRRFVGVRKVADDADTNNNMQKPNTTGRSCTTDPNQSDWSRSKSN